MPRRSTRHVAAPGDTTTLGSTYIRASQDIRPPPPPASDSGNTTSQSSPARRSARLEALQNTIPQAPVPNDDDDTSKDEAIVPFRLMDLPAEIRNRIYSNAFADTPKRDISYFSIPPLTLASKQLRSESLPIFFAETHFRLVVGGNFNQADHAPGTVGYRYVQEAKSRSGTLGSARVVGSLLKAAGKSAVFRHIAFEIYNASDIEEIRGMQRYRARKPYRKVYEYKIVLEMHLEVGTGGVLNATVVEEGNRHPRQFPRTATWPGWDAGLARHVQEIEDAVEKATAIARDMARQYEFKGFKMSDLRKIAKAFRVE